MDDVHRKLLQVMKHGYYFEHALYKFKKQNSLLYKEIIIRIVLIVNVMYV